MPEVYFGEFRRFVLLHLREVEATGLEDYSIEWFILKYLKRIVRLCNPPSRKGQIDHAIRGLMRFYIDNLDEHSELGDRCQKVYDEYRKTIRLQQGVQ